MPFDLIEPWPPRAPQRPQPRREAMLVMAIGLAGAAFLIFGLTIFIGIPRERIVQNSAPSLALRPKELGEK